MTEPSSQYRLSTSLPVASPATYLLLVDSRVSNYQDIINAKQPGVYHIVFDAATRPTHSAKLIKDIEDQIAALGVPAFTSIGLVQHNDGRPIYEMFGRISDRMKPVISDVATRDPDIQSWNRISLFITMLRLNYGIVNFDMMACALYSDPNWKYVIDKLTAVTGVTVRASTDDTGAASLGGDWFLESHTGANLKEFYFTEAIENYTGVLYTAPSSQSASVPPAATTAKKLILIDNRIKDIDVIINAMNEDTYCLVFNYFYDTPASILSKLRFLTGNNRYILDNFHYAPPPLPTRMDASGNHCTPCDDFDTNDILLLPGILENEYLEYTMSGGDASGNGGVWPFYNESTNITIHKPVFFQRAKIGETTESVPHGSTDGTVVATTETIVLNYKPRPMVLVSDLDAFYELGQNVGEIGSVPVAFDCVGIIQHTIDPTIGYKFVGGSDDTVAHAIVQDVVSRDSSLSSWAPFTAFIQAMKTAHQMTTLDLMACALYANPDWKFVIDTLAVRENITIRASLDNTGSGTDEHEDEANWVLETDNISLTTVYFTDKIYDWKYVLATYIDSRFNALRWNDSMYATRAYDARLKIAAGTSSFTIEAWYYETTTRSDATIVDMGDYNYTFQIRRGGANWISINNSSVGWIDANIAMTPGQWNHIAVTRSGSTFTFYLNGTARQTITNSTSFSSNNSTFAIGLQSPDTCLCNRQKTDSVLYDIRLWNVARTATEIQMNRNRIVPANSTGLVANYLCTDNGSTFNDRSVNALHTTIQNYSAARWSNNTVTIPNIGFLINNGFSLTTSSSSTALNAFTHFDNITYTDFSGVDLSGVNFRGADLTGCNFTNANLTNTNFANAYLINATTTNATTTGSNITQAVRTLTSTVVNFDGIDDAVDLGVPTWTYSTQFRTTMTVECWFKTTDTNSQKGSATLVARYNTGGSAGGAQFLLGVGGTGAVTLALTNTSGTWFQVTSPLTYKDMLWHHAAATYNSATGVSSIYVDGVLVNSGTNASYGLLSNNTTLRLTFGSDDAGLSPGNQTDRQFRGQLSDVRIWNVIRSAAEIAANYQRRLVGNETGLLGYWKLNQGLGSGWGSYNRSLDSTSNRVHGTLTNMGASPSGSWIVSNLNYQPQISTMTLGAKNGVYNSSDLSFSMIDPSSNSFGDFTYSVNPTTVATVVNGAATTKTIFATTGAISIPTLTLFNFPEIASLSSWQIDISFTVTGGSGTWRALVGDMYNEVNNSSRGWGLWVSANNPSRIHWSWMGATAEPGTITVSLNTAYVLTAALSSGTITLTLRTVSSGATQTGTISMGSNVIGKGPVTIGGWRTTSGEIFPGTISYVNVSVPTNQRVVSFFSSTNVGTPATVTATQTSFLDHSNGTRTASLTVNKVAPTFSTSFSNVTRTNYQTFTFTLPVSNSNGAFSFTSSNTSAATINPPVGVNALQFNGTTNFIDFGTNITELGKASFTIECWVKTSGTAMGLLNCQNSNTAWEAGEKSLYIDENGIPAFVGSFNNWIYSTVPVNDNTWHHLAVTWAYSSGTSGTAAFYVDGINRTSTDYSLYTAYVATNNNIGTFTFGKPNYTTWPYPISNFFNGAVCELRIWNVARSASEIYQNYQRILLGNETGLVAYHRFNQGVASGTNTSITTVSSNLLSGGNTGTLSGAFTLTGSSSNWVSGLSLLPVYDVNILNNGTTTITAAQAETSLYTSLSTTATLTVSIPTPTISALSIPSKTFGDSSFNITNPTSNSTGLFSYVSSNTNVATVTKITFTTTSLLARYDTSQPSNYTLSGTTVTQWNDLTGNGYHLIQNGTGPTLTTINSITAFDFNSSKGFIRASVPLSSTITVFMVIKYSTNIGTWGSFMHHGNRDSDWAIERNSWPTALTSHNLQFQSNNVNGPPELSTSNNVNYILIGRINGSTREFWRYSDTEALGFTTGTTVSIVTGDKTVYVGKSDNNEACNSTIGEILYYNSTLSNADVSANLNYLQNKWFNNIDTPSFLTIVGAGTSTITATQAATTNYTAGSVSASLVVSAIAPTIGTLTAPAKNFGDASFNLTEPTSNSGGAFSYTSSNTAVATVTTGGTVTIVGAGTTTITATQAASGNYASGSVSASLVVSPIAPTIGTLTAPAKNFGDASFNLTAPTSNSGGAFSYTSSNTSVATVTSGGTVTVVGVGSTTITATQAATTNYTGGSSVTASLVVSPVAPTIGALSVPAKNFGDASFNLTAPTSNSGGAFSYTSSNTAVATVTSGGTVTVVGAGSTTITATQAATTNYTTGAVSASLVVSAIAPTIGTLTAPAKNFGDASFNLTAPTSNSGGAFSYTSSNTAVATVTSGGTVTVIGAGTTTITATQAASGNYASGSVSASLVVSPIAPTIGTLTAPAKNFGDASFNLTAPTSNSGGAFSYTSSNTAVATVTSGGTVTVVGAGSTTITATQAATTNYTGGAVSASLVVSAIAPTIGTLTAPAKNFGDASFNLTAPTSNSGGAFTYTSSNTSVATVTSGGTVTVVGAGSTTITATQAATTNYTSGSVTASLVVSPVAPTIGALSMPAKNFGDASFNLTAPASNSGGAFSYTSSNTSVATVTTGGTVTVVGAGSTTITATQAASSDGNYIAGAVSASLVVSAIAPTIGTLTAPAKNFGDASFNLTSPTSNSGGAFSYTSSNTSVATVTTGGTVTVVGAGSTTITATQAASSDGNYTSGAVSASLVVSPIAPTIGALSAPAKNFGDASFNLTAPTSDSDGAFSYTSSNTSVATVTSGGTVTVVGVGSTTITATQAATTNYTGGAVSASLVVSPVAPTFGTFTIPEKFINDISFTLTAPTSNSNGAFTFSTDASGSAIATVTSGGIVTLTGVAGTATITATQAASANGNYTSRSVTATLIVNAALSNFTVPSNKVYADAAFDLTDPTTIYSGEPFIFTSSDTTVASIGGAGGRTVTIHKAGSTTITAKQVATGEHPELTISAVLVIAKKTTVITLSAITKNYGDASFNISPSSTNTDALTPTFTITSRNTDIISIFDGSYAAITGVGSVLIDITQSETTNFTSGSASVSIVVSKGTPVLSTFSVSTGRTYGSAPFSALAYPTSVSNGAIVYSSSDSTVASIDSSSGIITLLKAGYVNFVATQQATAYYNSATKVSNTMTVYRQILPLTRSSPTSSTINKTYGDGYFNVIATNASNGGTITYETNNPSVAGIVGSATAGVISVVSAGTATITARRGETDQYESAPVSWTVEVARTTTTLSGLSDLSYNVTAAPFTVSASSASDGAVTYSLQDPSSGVLTIHPTTGLVTLRSPGSAVIVASQAQGTNYLAPASITATITVSSAGNALQGATITSTASFAAVNLEGASLAGVSITNTAFTAAKLTNANLTNAVIVSANFASADLSGATLAGATITGATFTAASLKNADLSGAVLTNTAFTGSDLSGAKLTGVDASGASFANAKLNNVDLTGANIANVNFTNTSIKGAIIDDVSFSPLQKLQLLKNSENRDIGQIIIPAVTGTTVLAAISETSPLRAIENLDLATATVAVVVPTTSTSPTDVLPDVVLNVADSDKFYLPINESEFFQIEGVKYYATGGVVRNYLTNAVVEVISYNGTPVWLIAGSIVGLVLQTNTLNSSSFVIPSRKLLTDTSPFMPTTLPTSNNTETPIVYSSSNPNIATINASSGEITVTGNFVGFVHFTATQVQNATYEPGTSVSNTLFVDRSVTFTLSGLNQTFNLSTLATLDASSISVEATDATAVFYVRLSDINNIFMYQSDASDITNVSADDIKYYVFHRNWPTELKLNPSHAMMNKNESAGMLGAGDGFTNDKSLAKHDFIRYIALRLFNTIHAVDLFHNETELNENSVFLGETVRDNIDTILSGISTTSSSGTMLYDASGNKYLTNDASGNTNLCREIMRHIAAVAPTRFYGNVPNHAGLKNVPFIENDTLQYKLVVQAAASQNMLTGVSEIPSRSYTIKLVLKNTVNSNTNANSAVSDSIMYPNSYPYSSSVITYPPTSESSGVYNLYSPPAPIPFARFGYNGWYYTNSTTWVNVAPTVRNHIKWLVGGNTATSKVGDLQYVRINLKIHNTASLPYVMIYTQAGSSRKYAVVSGNGSLTNGTVYSFYMNFHSYAREPAHINHTNAALGYTIGTGSFDNNETITSIALESDSNAAASNVEFTLSSIVIGELSTTTNLVSEKEYGFQAAVPVSYP